MVNIGGGYRAYAPEPNISKSEWYKLMKSR